MKQDVPLPQTSLHKLLGYATSRLEFVNSMTNASNQFVLRDILISLNLVSLLDSA